MTQQSTPPQTPTPTGSPDLPPLTRGQKIKYSLVSLVIVGGIGALIAWNVIANNQETARNNDIKATGIHTMGTANGEAHEFTNRNRRSSSTKYKAIYDYTYTNEDRDGRQEEGTAIGEKVFDSKEEVQAIKGKQADVYYNDKGGTYVENEP